MGICPQVYDVHGWHPFESGWQGEDWCGKCDCLIDEHVSAEEYEQRRQEFEDQAVRYRLIRAEEDCFIKKEI